MAAIAETKTRAKKGSPVPPCADCGTRFGKIQKGRTRPDRFSGEKFGLSALCSGCYEKHTRRQTRVAARIASETAQPPAPPQRTASRYARAISRRFRPANSCDLCWGTSEERFDGAEFGIEADNGGPGRICGQCREELRQERAVHRAEKLAKVAIKNHCYEKNQPHRVYCLPVLTPPFFEAELTTRAICRLAVAEAKKRERRVAG